MLLPEPTRPSMATFSPAWIFSETPSRALVSAPGAEDDGDELALAEEHEVGPEQDARPVLDEQRADLGGVMAPDLAQPRGDVDERVGVGVEEPLNVSDVFGVVAKVYANEGRSAVAGDQTVARREQDFTPREARVGERP